ncbi:MAG TPA: N,N'-diacetylchitobiose phosphorylase, partial [Gammaproteobacteria bacterium]
YSPRFGASRVPWLTGAATWAYQAASQYILGIRPEYTGLRIDPCIPADWKEIKVQRLFRDMWFRIHIRNPNGVEKGVQSLTFNGKSIQGSLIPIEDCAAENEVTVTMG